VCTGCASPYLGRQSAADAGRYHSAHLILLLALEELGSAIQLYEAGRSEVQHWEAWWGRYYTHPKTLESTSLGIPSMAEADERSASAPLDLAYVDFDENEGRFIAPSEDEDSRLRWLVEREKAYAEGVLGALPPYAFERWEFQDLAQQSPEIMPSVLYARIEEILSEKPAASERELLTAIALDLGRSPDDFAAGFERWKEVAPKARVYLDLVRSLLANPEEGVREGPFEVSRTGDGFESDSEGRVLSESPAEEEARDSTNGCSGAETLCTEDEAQVLSDEGTTFQPESVLQPTTGQDREGPSYVAVEQLNELVTELGSDLGSQVPCELPQPALPATPPQSPPLPALSEPIATDPQTASGHERNLHQFIYVRYQQSREGRVDDITLGELLESKRISHFYRPSEEKWVDVSVDPLRRRGETNVSGYWRRASDREENGREKEKKYRGFFSGFFKSSKGPPPQKKQLSALEWFEQGFAGLHTTGDLGGAARAFALSIRLDPTNHRAYINRGLAYQKLGNMQQAIEDYGKAISVNSDDGKVYYLRGLALKRLDMHEEAVTDIIKAADLGYRPAYDFIKSERISW
jgi:hypothetical protein